jgi:ATP-dependent Clp protease protease subunit
MYSMTHDEELKHIKTHGNEIYFYCDVTEESVLEFVVELTKIDKHLRGQFKEPPSIYVYINSSGGDLHAGLGAYDAMTCCESHIVTICQGWAASAAAVLFLAGDERRITQNSYVLIHQLGSEMSGKFEELKDELSACTKLMRNLRRICCDRTSIPKEYLDKLFQRDILIGPSKCIKYGIAHEKCE